MHPTAWGGAGQYMLAGQAQRGSTWGQLHGATSDAGKEFEASIIVRWLVEKYDSLVSEEQICVSQPQEVTEALRPLLNNLLNPNPKK
jgi:hypothetical protein